MLFSTSVAAMAALVGFVAAVPTNAPLRRVAARSFDATSDEDFPNPNPTQQIIIQQQAGGGLPTGGAPTVNPKSTAIFQLIQFNENFEVAFFNSFLQNVTQGIDGFTTGSQNETEALIAVLTSVLAQEELHALNAQAILQANKVAPVLPCKYNFGTADIPSAIRLASTFTDVVLGTLQDAQQGLAINGDAGPVRAVGSVMGQEGEQNGFYRNYLGAKPSAKPFLTTSVAEFAFSQLLSVSVCDPAITNAIPIRSFPLLKVQPEAGFTFFPRRDQTLSFSADITGKANMMGDGSNLFVTYLTGPNIVYEKVLNPTVKDNIIQFTANFPYSDNFMDGLTIAALTNKTGFATPDEIPNNTLAAPGLIEINDCVDGTDDC